MYLLQAHYVCALINTSAYNKLSWWIMHRICGNIALQHGLQMWFIYLSFMQLSIKFCDPGGLCIDCLAVLGYLQLHGDHKALHPGPDLMSLWHKVTNLTFVVALLCFFKLVLSLLQVTHKGSLVLSQWSHSFTQTSCIWLYRGPGIVSHECISNHVQMHQSSLLDPPLYTSAGTWLKKWNMHWELRQNKGNGWL